MKSKFILLSTAAVSLIVLLVFMACPKPTVVVDPVANILKDLDSNSYHITFTNDTDHKLIAKDSYGNLSDLTMVSLDELGVTGLKGARMPLAAFQTIGPATATRQIIVTPNKYVRPTCFDWLPDYLLAKRFVEIGEKSNWSFAKDLTVVNVNNGGFLATNSVLNTVRGFKTDRVDSEGLKGVDANKVLLLFPESGLSAGITRPSYGNANLSGGIVGTASATPREALPLKKFTVKDLFPPRYWGCYDIDNLSHIKENFAKINPAVFGNSKITDIGGGINQISF